MVGWFREEERRGEDSWIVKDQESLLTFSRFKSHSVCYFNYRYLVTLLLLLLCVYIYIYVFFLSARDFHFSILQNLTSYTCEKIKFNSKYICLYIMLLIIHRMYRSNFQLNFR